MTSWRMEPSISQRSQIKEDTVKPSVPAREFNLRAYGAITWHNDPASLGLKPRLADHCSEAAVPRCYLTAPPRQAVCYISNNTYSASFDGAKDAAYTTTYAQPPEMVITCSTNRLDQHC